MTSQCNNGVRGQIRIDWGIMGTEPQECLLSITSLERLISGSTASRWAYLGPLRAAASVRPLHMESLAIEMR